MSKRETPMIRKFWKAVGGTLVEEFPIVKSSPTCGPRRLDAVILPTREFRRADWKEISLDDEDVIIVQAKDARLGMYLMGQVVFSAELVKRFFKPKSLRSIALCKRDDSVLRPLLAPFPEVEVVVLDDSSVPAKKTGR